MCNIKCVSPSTVLTVTDYVCDYTPLVSTCSNIVDLFLKAVISINRHCCNGNLGQKNRYFKHLDNKSVLRCLGAAIPFVGNGVVAIYDICSLVKKFKTREKERVLEEKERDLEVFDNKVTVFICVNIIDEEILIQIDAAFKKIEQNLNSVKDKKDKEQTLAIEQLTRQVNCIAIAVEDLQHHIYDFAVAGKLIDAASAQLEPMEIDKCSFTKIDWNKIVVAAESEGALRQLKDYLNILGDHQEKIKVLRGEIEALPKSDPNHLRASDEGSEELFSVEFSINESGELPSSMRDQSSDSDNFSLAASS